MSSERGSGNQSRIMRTRTWDDVEESEVIPSSLEEIAPILRVANEVDATNPRVAYLCRFYAFERAHRLDPTCSGRGVRKFRTALLHRLERDNQTTMIGRTSSDSREMCNFYQDYYQKYIQALQSASDRSKTAKSYQTCCLLFEVLKAVNHTEPVTSAEISEPCTKVEEKTQSINLLLGPEIQGFVSALRNTRGLEWPTEDRKRVNKDILDWLQAVFGFQKDNADNQREHLIRLLANSHAKTNQKMKLDDRALTTAMNKLLNKYKRWCKHLGRKCSLWLPKLQQEELQQRKLLYMGLYLLIWGEAANLRLMPDCLHYIYHHMAFELYAMLAGSTSPITGELIKPSYGGEDEAFSRKVVKPIQDTIAQKVEKYKGRIWEYSEWRNYYSLNGYFRSVKCFRLGWPMRDFFQLHEMEAENCCVVRKVGCRLKCMWWRIQQRHNQEMLHFTL